MAKEGNKRKPVNPENGWNFRKKFIDEEGYEFEKGEFTGIKYEKDDAGNWVLPEESPKKPPEDKSAEKKAEEPSPEEKNPLQVNAELLKRLEEMEKQLKDQQKQFKESLRPGNTGAIDAATLANALVQAEKYQSGGKYYSDIRDIDPDDYSDKPFIFTSYGGGYVIVDDVRNGRPVRTPYGNVIRFKFAASRITRVGRTDTYSSFCQYKTNSRSEAEWLRSHSKFGIEFFEDNPKQALDADVFFIQVASSVAKNIHKLETSQLLERARAYGIELGGDLDDIRNKIIIKETSDQMKRNEHQMERIGTTILRQQAEQPDVPAPGIPR